MRRVLPVLLVLAACGAPDPAPPAGPPAADRFERRVLVEGMDEPMQLEFDAEGRVYWIERGGALRRLDETSGAVELVGEIPVRLVGEAGLTGFALDPDFDTSRRLFVYYTAPTDERTMRLSRFRLGPDDRLDLASEVVLLSFPFDHGSHMGGGMTWDGDGNLYLTTGDDSDATQYNPVHWTNPGGAGQDAQRTAANTADLRGKILRIHPEEDGSYTIPAGNLFPPGTPEARPEIYTMGNRNPWRVSVDAETGYLHWGEVGPDAGADSAGVGPMGYDELNVARAAGNYGWPLVIGAGRPYHTYDYDARTYGPPVDPARPVNVSPNNTGMRALPPARPAALAYPYGVHEAYPHLGTGGRNADGGPVLRRAAFPDDAARVFPAYYEGAWFVADFVRNWIMAVRLDTSRTAVTAVERFAPHVEFRSIIDLDFGPDGDLYALEYGTQWFQQNDDARLSKIVYNAGNRAPRAAMRVLRTAGAAPFPLVLSAEDARDPDGDRLSYAWTVTPRDGGPPRRLDGVRAETLLEAPGVYEVELAVTDPDGAVGRDVRTVTAGNEPPEVALEMTEGNRTFFTPGAAVGYRVRVTDLEDGALGAGVASGAVAVTAEYVPAGLTPDEARAAADLAPDAPLRHLRALGIMAGSDCRTCHLVDEASAGPSFRAVAARYAEQSDAPSYLARRIVAGGSGVWGEAAMPAHPALTPAEARTLADYVLSLAAPDAAPRTLAPEGRFEIPGGEAAPRTGAYVLRARYTDRGAPGADPLAGTDLVLLRPHALSPETADIVSDGISYTPSRDPGFVIGRDGAHVGFEGIDLTGIDRIEVDALTRFYTWTHFVGAVVEVRLGGPDGAPAGPPVAMRPEDAVALGPPPADAGGDGAPGGPVYFDGDVPAAFDVSGTDGVHDVYVVFTNPEAADGTPLLLLRRVVFHPADR